MDKLKVAIALVVVLILASYMFAPLAQVTIWVDGDKVYQEVKRLPWFGMTVRLNEPSARIHFDKNGNRVHIRLTDLLSGEVTKTEGYSTLTDLNKVINGSSVGVTIRVEAQNTFLKVPLD